jgi:hypothetical protein
MHFSLSLSGTASALGTLVSDEVLPTLERLLRFDGFVYKLVDANSV